MQQMMVEGSAKSCLDGLWVVLTGDDAGGELPVMAKAGNERNYLLGFKNMQLARKFVSEAAIEAVPRLVVKGNRGEVLRIARENGAAGLLVDYDVTTAQYASAQLLD